MKQVAISFRYLVRGKVNALTHLKPATALSWGLFLVPAGWLVYAAMALLQEHAGQVSQFPFELTAGIFAAVFSMFSFATLMGMTSAQSLNYEKLKFLPLRTWQVYALELLEKLIILGSLLGVVVAPALQITTLLGFGVLEYARLAGVTVLFVLLAVETLTLLLVLMQGGVGAARGLWRMAYTFAFLGGYTALIKVRPRDAAFAVQLPWTPWAMAARGVLDASLADIGILTALTLILFPLGMLVYRWAYLRERPGVGRLGIDGSGLLVALGWPLRWLNRGAGRILVLDFRQVFRDPYAYSLFLFPVVFVVALDAVGFTRLPGVRFYVPFLLAVEVTLLLGLNPIGRDGNGFKLLRLLPVSLDQILVAKIAFAFILTWVFGAVGSFLWLWGDWPGLGANGSTELAEVLVALTAWVAFCSTLAVYLGVLYPTYGKLAPGPTARFPFLIVAAALPFLAYQLPAMRMPILIGGSLAGVVVLYRLARQQLAAWAVEQMGKQSV
jgi:hypothetical protein